MAKKKDRVPNPHRSDADPVRLFHFMQLQILYPYKTRGSKAFLKSAMTRKTSFIVLYKRPSSLTHLLFIQDFKKNPLFILNIHTGRAQLFR